MAFLRLVPPPGCPRGGSLPHVISLCLCLWVVLNQKFADCFVLVFLDSHLEKDGENRGGGLLRNFVSA